MPLGIEIKDDIAAAKRLRLPWWGVLLVVVIGFGGAWFFDQIGKPAMVLPALNGLATLALTFFLKRSLRRHVWFWITMAIFAVIHLLLVVLIPWTTRWVPALAIAVIDSAGLIVMLAILAAVGKIMGEPKGAEGQPRSL